MSMCCNAWNMIFIHVFTCYLFTNLPISAYWNNFLSECCLPSAVKEHFYLQELIKNKAKSGQSCCLLEDAFSMVSCLPWRSDNLHQVSLIENYPAPLTALGEPVRQVGADDFTDVLITTLWYIIACKAVFSFTKSTTLPWPMKWQNDGLLSREASQCGRKLQKLRQPLEGIRDTSFSSRSVLYCVSWKKTPAWTVIPTSSRIKWR